MKAAQFKYRQGTGVATVFTAEDEGEIAVLDVLKELIEDEQGALSRKCFTFDPETDSMSIDMERYNESSRRNKASKKSAATDGSSTKKTKGSKADK